MCSQMCLDIFKGFLHDLYDDVRRKATGMIVTTGDFNSKSPMWESVKEDRRGVMLGEVFSSLGMSPLNLNEVLTFVTI